MNICSDESHPKCILGEEYDASILRDTYRKLEHTEEVG